MRFNLSEWALNHRSFVVYCMVALTIVVLSLLRLATRPLETLGTH